MLKLNTFIVPTLNYDGVKKTLESIRKYTPPNFDIILIDQREKYLEEVEDRKSVV